MAVLKGLAKISKPATETSSSACTRNGAVRSSIVLRKGDNNSKALSVHFYIKLLLAHNALNQIVTGPETALSFEL